MSKELIDNTYAKIWIDNGVMFCFFKTSDIDLDIAKMCVASRIEAANNVDFPTLIDISNVKTVTKAARDYFALEENLKCIKAGALIIKSPVNKIIGNFFLKVNNPPRPAKIFIQKKEAINWLTDYVVHN